MSNFLCFIHPNCTEVGQSIVNYLLHNCLFDNTIYQSSFWWMKPFNFELIFFVVIPRQVSIWNNPLGLHHHIQSCIFCWYSNSLLHPLSSWHRDFPCIALQSWTFSMRTCCDQMSPIPLARVQHSSTEHTCRDPRAQRWPSFSSFYVVEVDKNYYEPKKYLFRIFRDPKSSTYFIDEIESLNLDVSILENGSV